MAMVPEGAEIFEISSDEDSDCADSDFLNDGSNGADKILRDLFPEIVLPPSPGPARKKRALNSPNWSDIADSSIEGIDLSGDDLISAASSHTSLTYSTPNGLGAKIDSETICLTRTLEVFPDISHSYFRDLYHRHKGDDLPSAPSVVDPVERIIEEVLDNLPYPKQRDAKRKRSAPTTDDDDIKWKESFMNRQNDVGYIHTAGRILINEFPLVPAQHIRQLMDEKKSLYSTYLALSASESSPGAGARRPYDHLKKARKSQRSELFFHVGTGQTEDPLRKELDAAKKKVAKEAEIIRHQKEMEQAEKLNEEEYRRAGALVECQCCFTDTPSNRAVPCEGETVHFFCFSCIKNGAETQIGLMKYEMKCFDISGCKAGFFHSRLSEAVGPSVMAKLESLQQQDEIAKAGIEGLEDCPFCNFKAICPPVEEDREFRCYNPDCEKVSCRLCREETHIPKTCEEAKKEKGIPERHLVEEAMSEALIRTCPNCKVKIIKELGCNKMACVQCKCLMCYICKKDITREGYNHFGKPRGCQVHDNGRVDRHQEEIERAEKAAIEKIRTENPDLNQEDLRVNRPENKERATKNSRVLPTDAGLDYVFREHLGLYDLGGYEHQRLAMQGGYAQDPMQLAQFAPFYNAPNPNLTTVPQVPANRPGDRYIDMQAGQAGAYYAPYRPRLYVPPPQRPQGHAVNQLAAPRAPTSDPMGVNPDVIEMTNSAYALPDVGIPGPPDRHRVCPLGSARRGGRIGQSARGVYIPPLDIGQAKPTYSQSSQPSHPRGNLANRNMRNPLDRG